MSAPKLARFLLILIGTGLVALLAVGVAAAIGVQSLAPATTAFHYPWSTLAQDADIMNECAECHEAEKFHTCDSCHDDHGSAEMAGVPFNALVLLCGDLADPGYIPVNEIVPYRNQPNTHIALLDFLAEHGVDEFESVTLTSRDGGFVTFEKEYLTAEALLMPHVDGIRFAAENLHVSTWLKGIARIIVVSHETPLTINGKQTSIGRLMLGPTRNLTIEQADVMLKSDTDGQVRKGKTANRLEGAPINLLVSNPDFSELVVRDTQGAETVFEAWEAWDAVLAQLRGRPEVVLVLPNKGRSEWVFGVAAIATR